jgi:spore germination protein GerM
VISSTRAPIAIALLAVIGLLAGACSPITGPLGTPASPRATTSPSGDPAASDVIPATTSPYPDSSADPTPVPGSTGPSTEPTATPGATPVPSPVATTTLRAYFLTTTATGGIVVVPVLREVPGTKAVAAAALTALLAGPSDVERSAGSPITTTIPAGTRLLGVTINGGVATVNLSAEFGSGGGSASMFGRLAQVTYTLTQFPNVTSVLFQLEGSAVTVFGSEGIILDHAVGRADYRDHLPAIFLDRPAWGAAAGNPARINGLANVFEATFRVQIRGAAGSILADQQVMASCGTGCWGTFQADVPYTVTTAQYGTILVFDLSAKDGTPENVSEYRVWLTPAG